MEQHKSNPDVKDVLIDIYALDKIYKDVQISVSEVESVSREGSLLQHCAPRMFVC